MTMTTKELAELYTGALNYTAPLKGKARDRAIFDYLAGASAATYGADHCPPWLFVMGARGGDRLNELTREIARLTAKKPEGAA